MKTKINKESRNLMIAILLGDGSISKQNGFRMMHGEKQKEYLQWKINKLHDHGIRTCGMKESICSVGYNVGSTYYYTRLSVIPFVKVLRRVFYKPKKVIANRKMLNRLNALGVAIWFMDDGCINIRKTGDKIHGFYIRIATCLPKDELQVVIDYFKEVWDVSFYAISEGKGTFSLCCGTKEAVKFVDIVRPYVEEVPSMTYKIRYNLEQRVKPL